MIHLRSISRKTSKPLPETFPFHIPIIRALDSIEFTADITLLVGENGSGKSTLLEAIACAVGSITVGSSSVETDPTLAEVRALANHFKLTWNKRTHRGFFLRSEDFFGFVKHIAQTRADLESELKRVDREYQDRSAKARGLAKMPFARELGDLQQYYGEGLDAQSHGESYFKLFNARFVPDGLYLLDKPEMPLSPSRQLSFLNMLNMLVGQNAQFIIATHSPILLAYPGATILSCDGGQVHEVSYDELEHVNITRDFLNNRESYLRHLMSSDEL